MSGRKETASPISDLQRHWKGKYKAERITTLVKPMLYGWFARNV